MGWGGGILRPAPTADWPRLRELAGEGSVAGACGLQAAQGAPGQNGSLPATQLGQGSPRGSRPSAFPPWYLAAPIGFRTPGGRGGAGRGLSPGLCELSSALPAYLRGGRQCGAPGGSCAWSKLWGPPVLSIPGSRLFQEGITSGATSVPRSTPRPPAVGLPGPASALPCCRAPAAAARAVPQGRASTGAGSLASGAR